MLWATFSVAQNFTDVKPSPQQVAWQDSEIGANIHFGPNPLLDQEWGDSKAEFSIPHLWIPNSGGGLPSPPESQDALATGSSDYQDFCNLCHCELAVGARICNQSKIQFRCLSFSIHA
jgi:hypothetical protein